MNAQKLFKWHDTALRSSNDHNYPLLAADSWLIEDGAIRGVYLHRQRFISSCSSIHASLSRSVEPFFDHVLSVLPRTGGWFPRIELVDDGDFSLYMRLRPAPEIKETLTLTQLVEKDCRTNPRIKGPDLKALGRLRLAVQERGVDEAVITTPSGIVLEGLSTSIIWWDNNTLCYPPANLRVLPSVTRQLLLQMATRFNVPTAAKTINVINLHRHPVWALNALHGIREVTHWMPERIVLPCLSDTADWREQMKTLAVTACNHKPLPVNDLCSVPLSNSNQTAYD